MPVLNTSHDLAHKLLVFVIIESSETINESVFNEFIFFSLQSILDHLLVLLVFFNLLSSSVSLRRRYDFYVFFDSSLNILLWSIFKVSIFPQFHCFNLFLMFLLIKLVVICPNLWWYLAMVSPWQVLQSLKRPHLFTFLHDFVLVGPPVLEVLWYTFLKHLLLPHAAFLLQLVLLLGLRLLVLLIVAMVGRLFLSVLVLHVDDVLDHILRLGHVLLVILLFLLLLFCVGFVPGGGTGSFGVTSSFGGTTTAAAHCTWR